MTLLALTLALFADPEPLQTPSQAPPELPSPQSLPRYTRTESGDGRSYFLRQRESPRLGVRAGYGFAGHVAGPTPVRAAFALDVIAGARLSVSRRRPELILVPELGYSLTAGAHATRSHLFTVGFGLGLTTQKYRTLAFVPRFVVGTMLHQQALGGRGGILLEVGEGATFGLELAYQALVLPTATMHTLLITLHVGGFAQVR